MTSTMEIFGRVARQNIAAIDSLLGYQQPFRASLCSTLASNSAGI